MRIGHSIERTRQDKEFFNFIMYLLLLLISFIFFLLQSHGYKIFEDCPIIAKILPEALLKLFVDIEYTGHSMEFEQKFGMECNL